MPFTSSDFDLPIITQQIEMEEILMTTINLRDYYPDIYKQDQLITLPDEVVAILRQFKLDDEAYRMRTYRHRAYFSLDYGENVEQDALLIFLSPAEILEQKEEYAQLYTALRMLPNKQRNRIFAYYFLGMSQAEIAKSEGIDKSRISRSINAGLRRLEKILKNFF